MLFDQVPNQIDAPTPTHDCRRGSFKVGLSPTGVTTKSRPFFCRVRKGFGMECRRIFMRHQIQIPLAFNYAITEASQ